jgi:hypothetical protein
MYVCMPCEHWRQSKQPQTDLFDSGTKLLRKKQIVENRWPSPYYFAIPSTYIHTYIHTYSYADDFEDVEESLKKEVAYIHTYRHTYIHTYSYADDFEDVEESPKKEVAHKHLDSDDEAEAKGEYT